MMCLTFQVRVHEFQTDSTVTWLTHAHWTGAPQSALHTLGMAQRVGDQSSFHFSREGGI
jgi:hypothetical protein